jgi:hypothetical protein
VIDERVIVEKLDVKPGDVVLVLYPEDYLGDLNDLMDSFAAFGEECSAFFFGAPNPLRFKVVRAKETP